MELNVITNRTKAYNAHDIFSVEDLQNFLPKKYYDFTHIGSLFPENVGKEILINAKVFRFEKKPMKNNRNYYMIKCQDNSSKLYFNVFFFGYVNPRQMSNLTNAYICGKVQKNDYGYSISNPVLFVSSVSTLPRILPVYKKLSGISEDALCTAISEALKYNLEYFGREDLKASHGYYDHNKALHVLHNPQSMDEVKLANTSLVYEKIYTYLSELKNLKKDDTTEHTDINTKRRTAYLEGLPFTITFGQRHAIKSMCDTASAGKKITALLQGDVGSGKTVVAFALMCSMNCQSVLMAPTVILAKQHYDDFKPVADRLGLKVVFVSTMLSQTEKRSIEAMVKSGEADIIIGTHAVTNLEYKNLGLVIVDEEHRFGVKQREKLNGFNVHKLSMSATPIPRTLAGAVFENLMDIYDLEQPAERLPVKTYHIRDQKNILLNVVGMVRQRNQQVYVVCPAIEEDDSIMSVEEVYNLYKQTDLKIACVTGKMKKEEADNVISDFAKGDIEVLIATTVIEVGINVPNANLIVINNAERFGLSQLHQLRGRVGRGNKRGFCILQSAEETERINIMLHTTDGFEIAEKDMALRGSGNLLGEEQSGKNEYLDMIMEYPELVKEVKEDLEK